MIKVLRRDSYGLKSSLRLFPAERVPKTRITNLPLKEFAQTHWTYAFEKSPTQIGSNRGRRTKAKGREGISTSLSSAAEAAAVLLLERHEGGGGRGRPVGMERERESEGAQAPHSGAASRPLLPLSLSLH